VPSSIGPVPHSDELPIPTPPQSAEAAACPSDIDSPDELGDDSQLLEMISYRTVTLGMYVVTSKCWDFFLAYNVVSSSIHAFFVYGTVDQFFIRSQSDKIFF